MAAIYAVYTSPTHPPIPNHLPTLIVTPHGQPSNILYSYLHTSFNTENYLLTPSPQGDLCVAKLFPPKPKDAGKASASDPGHSSSSASRLVRCEASRNLKWSIANTGVISPVYRVSLPAPDAPDLPLFQVSKPNPNAAFWSMFYFAYAGHGIPPRRVEFGKIQKNPPGPNGGGTRISITGKTPEEKAVWQTLGEGNEDCVEWVVLCAALNLLDDEIMKAAEKNPPPPGPGLPMLNSGPGARAPVSLRDPGPTAAPPPNGRPMQGPGPGVQPQRPVPQHAQSVPIPGTRPPPGFQQQQPPRGYPLGQGPPPQGGSPAGYGSPHPHGYGPGPGPGQRPPPPQTRGGMPPGQAPPAGYGGRPPPQTTQQQPMPQQSQMQGAPPSQIRRF